jgi:twitching motility protein PilI
MSDGSTNLRSLLNRPYQLLLAMEQRARAAISNREGDQGKKREWIGVGFRLGKERFVTDRADVKEVLSVPEQLTRVPGAKSWLRGIANVRGQLVTIVDLKAFLGGGISMSDRQARVLVSSSREVPTGILVDEVVGFERFDAADHKAEVSKPAIRCEGYLDGSYRRGADVWLYFRIPKLLADETFLDAADRSEAPTR